MLLERQKDFNSVKSPSPEGLSSNFTPAAVFKATKSRFRLRRSPSAHKIVASNNERLSDLGGKFHTFPFLDMNHKVGLYHMLKISQGFCHCFFTYYLFISSCSNIKAFRTALEIPTAHCPIPWRSLFPTTSNSAGMQSAAQGDQIHFEICDEIKDFNTQNDKKKQDVCNCNKKLW